MHVCTSALRPSRWATCFPFHSECFVILAPLSLCKQDSFPGFSVLIGRKNQSLFAKQNYILFLRAHLLLTGHISRWGIYSFCVCIDSIYLFYDVQLFWMLRVSNEFAWFAWGNILLYNRFRIPLFIGKCQATRYDYECGHIFKNNRLVSSWIRFSISVFFFIHSKFVLRLAYCGEESKWIEWNCVKDWIWEWKKRIN